MAHTPDLLCDWPASPHTSLKQTWHRAAEVQPLMFSTSSLPSQFGRSAWRQRVGEGATRMLICALLGKVAMRVGAMPGLSGSEAAAGEPLLTSPLATVGKGLAWGWEGVFGEEGSEEGQRKLLCWPVLRLGNQGLLGNPALLGPFSSTVCSPSLQAILVA